MLLEEIALLALLLAKTSHSDNGKLDLWVSPVPEGDAPASPLERLRLLETLWPHFCRVLPACLSQRDTGLIAGQVWVPLDRTRGGPTMAAAVACSPKGAQAWLRRGQCFSNHRNVASYISEIRSQTTEATAAGRFVCHALHSLQREADALARLAMFCGETVATDSALQIGEQARLWRQRFLPDSLNNAPDAEKNPSVRASTLARQAAAWPVPYRRFLHLWQQASRSLAFDWSSTPLLSLAPRPEWQLYEIWCFLQVAKALQQNGWRLHSSTVLRWQQQQLRLVMATGGKSRLRFTRSLPGGEESLLLTYQPLYVSANRRSRLPGESPSSAGFRSRSHAMQPDLALLWRNRLFLLDPKFRAYALPDASEHGQDNALLDDVNKMHAYRDAIVRNQRPAVAQAWCLFPGSPTRSQPVIAFPRATVEEPFGSGGVGALRLRPGESNAPLQQLLASWMTEPASGHV